MTLYLNLRRQKIGGSVLDQPYMLQGSPAVAIGSLTAVPWADMSRLVAGRNLLFIVHGFNVNFDAGARMSDRLIPLLKLAEGDLAIGVLWPGDSFIPVINYPFAGNAAIASGKTVASVCRTALASARSLSFVSHSLGARVVLQALLGLDRPARSVTLTAAAINQGCLVQEYGNAARNTTTLSMLASKGDHVLKLAFPLGDPFSDLLYDDHPLFEQALGYVGPAQAEAALVEGPWQIPLPALPANVDYDHGSYLPPSDPEALAPAGTPPSYLAVAEFIANAFYGRPQSWPGPSTSPPRGFAHTLYPGG